MTSLEGNNAGDMRMGMYLLNRCEECVNMKYSDVMPCPKQHENFLDAYFKAASTSDPHDWMQAALMAKQWEQAIYRSVRQS